MSDSLTIIGVLAPDLLAALHGPCFADAWDTVAMAETLAVTGTFALVACLGTGAEAAPAGLAIVRVIGEEAELLTIGVLPDYRHRRVGTGLLAAVLDEVLRRGALYLFLEVAEDNRSARVLYGNCNAELIGRRKAYYRWPDGSRSDALVLRIPVLTAARDEATPCAKA